MNESKKTGDWLRVDGRRIKKCPVCGHDSWCLVTRDGTAVLCKRVESNNQRPEAGWFHWLVDKSRRTKSSMPRKPAPPLRAIDWLSLVDSYIVGLNRHLADHAAQLGVSEASLAALQTGWDGEALCFPMRNEDWQIVGVRRRCANGERRCVNGSREGCFGPATIPNGTFYVCEGPTDCAALLTLGLNAIGRPSCSGGTAILKILCKGRDVTIVGDNDKADEHGNRPGEHGALALGRALLPIAANVRVMFPPDGIKDTREWVRHGATRTEFEA